MNPNTHFYLYAKWHYQEGDLINDLKQILAKRSMVPLQYVQARDIAQVLLGIAWKHISESGNPESQFIEFVSRLNQTDLWGNPVPDEKRKDFYEILLSNCLSVLRNTKVAGLDLGKADPTILPLKASANNGVEKTKTAWYYHISGIARCQASTRGNAAT